jgi:hypothetical protein
MADLLGFRFYYWTGLNWLFLRQAIDWRGEGRRREGLSRPNGCADRGACLHEMDTNPLDGVTFAAQAANPNRSRGRLPLSLGMAQNARSKVR